MTGMIEGYGLQNFTWEVETTPGGPKVNFTGTVQEVASQLAAVNPNWKSEFGFSGRSTKKVGMSQKRQQLPDPLTGILCNTREGQWGEAIDWPIEDGIAYLDGVPGIPTNGPGPGNCGRVSCSWGCAIYWCNDVGII